jgi:hypothetical protein
MSLISKSARVLANRKDRFLFETATGLPMAPRNIARDSLHPLLKKMGCGSAGFHTFRRFREAVLQMSNARNLLIDFWMGHANSRMAGRYGSNCLQISGGGKSAPLPSALASHFPRTRRNPC